MKEPQINVSFPNCNMSRKAVTFLLLCGRRGVRVINRILLELGCFLTAFCRPPAFSRTCHASRCVLFMRLVSLRENLTRKSEVGVNKSLILPVPFKAVIGIDDV